MAQRRSKDRQVGVELREALKRFMHAQGRTASGWSKRAGVPESALRNFLAGRSHTLTHLTLMALAGAAEVPLSTLISGREDWGRTEAVHVCVAINATERPGESMSISDTDQFSIRVPNDTRYKEVSKFGAHLEDESASERWPAGSILVCADFDWITVEQRIMLVNRPGDLLVVLEKTTQYHQSDNSRTRYVRSTVRELLQDDGVGYLVSCSKNPRFLDSIRLPIPIIGKTITDSIVTGVESEIVISGKVLASFRAEGGDEKEA